MLTSDDYLDLCQRCAGMYAAGKNMHYAYKNYADHLLADRFVAGDAGGFDCFDAIDEIQESLVMYIGDALDVNDVFLYPEEYTVSPKDFKDFKKGVAMLADLYDNFAKQINDAKLNNAEGDILGNLARRAQRAVAFLRAVTKEDEKDDGRKNSNVAKDSSSTRND